MKKKLVRANLSLLRNQLDFTILPFSDRGSRLLLFQSPFQSQFYLKLAERLTNVEPGIETYLRRPPFLHNFYLIDEDGEKLEFEATTLPHVIYLKTRLGEFGLTFKHSNALSIGLPANTRAGIKFSVMPQLWKAMENGGEFRSIRDLLYCANSDIIKNQITPSGGGFTVEFLIEGQQDSTINLIVDTQIVHKKEVVSFYENLVESEYRWRSWFDRVPPVAAEYLQTYVYAWWVMFNNLVKPSGKIAFEAMMPSKINYVGLWLWDSAIHALAFRHFDPELARNQIRVMLACQLPNGMLPDAVYDEGVISEIDHPFKAEVTKPPILAWAALKLHETDPNLEFLQEIYMPLVRWNAWWFSMNDDDVDGLAQYNHPYSSGLDDNPLWDYGMPVESPELNTYLCVQMGSLALIAEKLGMSAEAEMWRRRTKAIVNRMIEDFWDEEVGIFRATHNHEPIPVITPFNLYPLWTGQLPDHIRQRLIGHLTNPDEFWGELAIPSVARSDSHYQPETMWRGPVWANVNYFFIEALEQVGERKLARELRTKTLNLIMRHPSIYEYYNADTGEPAPKAAVGFGWTAAIFIDLAISASRGRRTGKDLHP